MDESLVAEKLRETFVEDPKWFDSATDPLDTEELEAAIVEAIGEALVSAGVVPSEGLMEGIEAAVELAIDYPEVGTEALLEFISKAAPHVLAGVRASPAELRDQVIGTADGLRSLIADQVLEALTETATNGVETAVVAVLEALEDDDESEDEDDSEDLLIDENALRSAGKEAVGRILAQQRELLEQGDGWDRDWWAEATDACVSALSGGLPGNGNR